MALFAKPIAGKGKALLALACLLAMLFALMPCAMAVPAVHASAMPMDGMACAHCCSNAGTAAGPVMHCAPLVQPAETTAVAEVPHDLGGACSLPAPGLQVTRIARTSPQLPVLTPPLLHPVLRI